MEMVFTDEQYEQMAINAIIGYKNKDYTLDEITTLYPTAILLVIDNIKKYLAIDRNISQKDLGDRNYTYNVNNKVIDDVVKMIIGKPCLRMW
jgi:hypothetical protein